MSPHLPKGWVIASTGVEPLRGLRAADGGAAVMVVAQWAGSHDVLGTEGGGEGSGLGPSSRHHGRAWMWLTDWQGMGTSIGSGTDTCS